MGKSGDGSSLFICDIEQKAQHLAYLVAYLENEIKTFSLESVNNVISLSCIEITIDYLIQHLARKSSRKLIVFRFHNYDT